jgi:serpin B
VFGDDADLSGMDGKHELFLSQVRHGAWLEVDEKGTEAAAATAEVIPRKSIPATSRARLAVFHADHPFLFLLREEAAGSILFLGQVVDPREK